MEEVPEYGDPAELSAGGAVVFTEAGTENADAAEIFLEKVSLGIPCQLRTLQNYYESWPMLIDVIYDGRGFLWRMRTGGEITEKRFSYIVTDGTDVYLSNGADWESTEQYDSEKAFLLPSGSGSFLVPAAEAMTDDRLAENTARYRIWSGDGMRAASLTEDPAEFSVIRCDPESGTWSRSWTIRELDDRATAVRDLSWLESGALLHITYETEKDGTLTVGFVPDAELTDPGDLCGYPAE